MLSWVDTKTLGSTKRREILVPTEEVRRDRIENYRDPEDIFFVSSVSFLLRFVSYLYNRLTGSQRKTILFLENFLEWK